MAEDSTLAALFPGWHAPDRVAAFVAGRALVDTGLIAAVGLTSDPLAWAFALALVLAVAATALSYVVLGGRASETRRVQAGRVETLLRVAEIGLCGLLAVRSETVLVTAVLAGLGVAVALLTLVSFPLYGEATVAP